MINSRQKLSRPLKWPLSMEGSLGLATLSFITKQNSYYKK